jgi:hypothetical protein
MTYFKLKKGEREYIWTHGTMWNKSQLMHITSQGYLRKLDISSDMIDRHVPGYSERTESNRAALTKHLFNLFRTHYCLQKGSDASSCDVFLLKTQKIVKPDLRKINREYREGEYEPLSFQLVRYGPFHTSSLSRENAYRQIIATYPLHSCKHGESCIMESLRGSFYSESGSCPVWRNDDIFKLECEAILKAIDNIYSSAETKLAFAAKTWLESKGFDVELF